MGDGGSEDRGLQPAVVLLAGGGHQLAGVAGVGGAGGVDQQAEQPLGLRPALHRVLLVQLARVFGQPPDPRGGLVAAADPLVGERLEADPRALAALVAVPVADHLDRQVEGFGVLKRADLLQGTDPQLGVLVALNDGEQEAALELAVAVELQHRAGAAPAGRLHPGAGDRRPDVLLAVVEVLDVDPPQLALEHLVPAVLVGGHRQHAALHAHLAAAAAADRPDDDRPAAVDVAVQQRVERDDRVVVTGAGVDEVDDHARLLAGVAARHAAHALLVDPLGGGRREVHADGRARRVPALGEKLRVDQDVDVAGLVAGEDLGQLALGRLAGDRLGLDPQRAERLGDVVGVLDPGGVYDAGHPVEAGLVKVGDRQVERRLVEQLGEHLLVELDVDLALAQRHVGDRPHPRPGRNPQAAQRGDHAAAGGLREVEAGGLRGEEVGYVTGDQRAGGGHADEDRPGPLADRGAGLLPQRGVGLVADDDRVLGGDVAGVADEPLVGLDGHRAGDLRLVVAEQRLGDAVGVAAVLELAEELVDEVAAVGEDQDAAGSRGLDEAHRGDGLAGAGGVLEPEALVGVRVVDDRLVDVGVDLLRGDERVVERVDLRHLLGLFLLGLLLVLGELLVKGGELGGELLVLGLLVVFLDREDRRGAVVFVTGGVGGHLGGQQRGERSGKGVDLVGVERGAVGEVGLLLAEQPLEPEQQRPLPAPLGGGDLLPGVDLGERLGQRLGARRAGREGDGGLLALVDELLAGKDLRPTDIGIRSDRSARGGH